MLKQINQTGKFMTLIEADFRDADYIYKNYTFKDKHLKRIMAFLIITQDVYDKSEELCKFTSENDISTDLLECFELYFEKYANCKLQDIPNYDQGYISNYLWLFLPELIKLEPYCYPRRLETIKIIRNSKIYELERNQSDNNIKKAQKHIINMFANIEQLANEVLFL